MTAQRRICFVTDELHPTTWGGCGVLLHHAAELLLARGHSVVFLVDFEAGLVRQLRDRDRKQLPNPERCSVHSVDELLGDSALTEAEVASPFQFRGLRFAEALRALLEQETVDYVEFVEYCGAGYYSFAQKLYGRIPDDCVLGVRLHNSIELIDQHEATKAVNLDRYLLYGLERAGLSLAEAVLAPTQAYVDAYYSGGADLGSGKTVISQSPRSPFPEVPRCAPGDRDEIVYFGRVHQFKGVDKLLQAAVEWMLREPEFQGRMVFIGQDSKETPEGNSHIDYLKKLIPEAVAHRFEFTGQLDHEQSAMRLARARLAAFPNQFESFCYSLHEVYHAGIPVVVADLPGFRDFFRSPHNCLRFDGSVEGLVEAMKRLWNDPELCERLSCPHEVAVDPLGDWYEQPRRLAPLVEADGARPRVLVLLLGGDGEAQARSLHSLREQKGGGPDRVLLLNRVDADESGGLPLLGVRWKLRSSDGAEVATAGLRTLDAIWLLEGGDCPDPDVLSSSRSALANRASLGFAGTWLRQGGIVQPSQLDFAPELHPFQHGPQRTRVLLRTASDTPLVDLFDHRYGGYGEIAYLWKVWDEVGPGCLLPEAKIDVVDATPRPVDAIGLSFLVMSQRSPERLRRLARFSTVVHQDPLAQAPSPRRVKRLALRSLGAGTLFKLALRRVIFPRRSSRP